MKKKYKSSEKARATAKEWYKNNKEKAIKYQTKRYSENREARLEYLRQRRQKVRVDLMKKIGGVKCSICGFSDLRALQFDHIDGGGTKERRIMGISTWEIIKNISDNIKKYQVLCANCNWIKKDTNKELYRKY